MAEAADAFPVFDKLNKGLDHRAQWNDGTTPGYYHTDDGKLCWGVQDVPPPIGAPVAEGGVDASLFPARDILEDCVDNIIIDTDGVDSLMASVQDVTVEDWKSPTSTPRAISVY